MFPTGDVLATAIKSFCHKLNVIGLNRKSLRAPQKADEWSDMLFLSPLVVELKDVLFVIQSQRNSYHVQQAEKLRTDLLLQTQALQQVLDTFHLPSSPFFILWLAWFHTKVMYLLELIEMMSAPVWSDSTFIAICHKPVAKPGVHNYIF